MAGLARAGVDEAGIEPMSARQREREPDGVARNQDQMDVVGHQAIGPDLDPEFAAGFGEPIAIERVVLVAEKDALAPIAALSDVVGNAGQDDASDAGHGGQPSRSRSFGKDGRVTVFWAGEGRIGSQIKAGALGADAPGPGNDVAIRALGSGAWQKAWRERRGAQGVTSGRRLRRPPQPPAGAFRVTGAGWVAQQGGSEKRTVTRIPYR